LLQEPPGLLALLGPAIGPIPRRGACGFGSPGKCLSARGRGPALEQLPDDDPPGHHRQVGCQTALAAETAENCKVILDQGEHDVGAKIVAILAGEPNGLGSRRMIDHVNHQPEEAIDKVFPGPGFSLEAAIEKMFIYFCKRHGLVSYAAKLLWEEL
jgi:hypothetical protein